MGTLRKTSLLGLAVMGLITVQTGIADTHASLSSPHCCKMQTAADLLGAKRFAEHSSLFRRAAENAWRATYNGDAPFEAGFSIDRDGRPGKIQLSMFETVSAATHLTIVSNSSAIGSLHVHNRFGQPMPSRGDIRTAELRDQMVYVESRTGLYVVDPDGTVHHLFNRIDWYRKTCAD